MRKNVSFSSPFTMFYMNYINYMKSPYIFGCILKQCISEGILALKKLPSLNCFFSFNISSFIFFLSWAFESLLFSPDLLIFSLLHGKSPIANSNRTQQIEIKSSRLQGHPFSATLIEIYFFVPIGDFLLLLIMCPSRAFRFHYYLVENSKKVKQDGFFCTIHVLHNQDFFFITKLMEVTITI